MQKADKTIKVFGWLSVGGMAYHFYWYRYWEENCQEVFFSSLYLWLWLMSLNGLKEAKDNVKRALWGIQVAAAFNFLMMEWYGKPWEDWTKANWIGTILSLLHGLLVLLHCLFYKKYWYQITLLFIKDYFYKLKGCITTHKKK